MHQRTLFLPGCVALLLACGAALAATPAAAQCPASYLQGAQIGTASPTESAFFDSVDVTWVRGDHTTGRFALSHPGTLYPTIVIGRDAYDLAGVPAGTPVGITVRFVVDALVVGECGYCDATVTSGGVSATAQIVAVPPGAGQQSVSGVVELPLVMTAGTPTMIEFKIEANRCSGHYGTTEAHGQVVFDGADPSASVVSCKGFGPLAVPVLPRSWGALKTMYR